MDNEAISSWLHQSSSFFFGRVQYNSAVIVIIMIIITIIIIILEQLYSQQAPAYHWKTELKRL